MNKTPDTVQREIIIAIERDGELPKRLETTAPTIPTGKPQPVSGSNALRGFEAMPRSSQGLGIWLAYLFVALLCWAIYDGIHWAKDAMDESQKVQVTR